MSGMPTHDREHLWQMAGRGFEQLFQSASGHDVVRVPGGMLAVTGVAAPDLNCGIVWVADGGLAVARTLADELHRRELPGILLVADAVGRESHEVSAHEGMIAAGRMPLMTRSPGPIAAHSRFTVHRARSPDDLSAANHLIATAFELPVSLVNAAFGPRLLESEHVAIELVHDGDDTVGSLQTTNHGELLGIWSMATHPAQRRRGIARAGLSHVLTNGGTNDVIAFLIATEAGRPLYDAVGFRNVAWCTAWVVPQGGRSPEPVETV